MSKIYANPFSWGKPVSGQHYVSRSALQSQVISAIEDQDSLIITGKRGAGKSSMIKQVLDRHGSNFILLDLSFVVTLSDLNGLIISSVMNAFPKLKQSETLLSLQEDSTLESVLHFVDDLARQKDQTIIIVWDEFQAIAKLKSDSISELKNSLSTKSGLKHVFISPREDVLRAVLMGAKNQLFKKIAHIDVGALEEKSFNLYLTKRFRRMGLNDFDLADTILNFTQCNAQLSQIFAHSVAQLWIEGTSTRLFARSLSKMLQEHDSLFTSQWDSFGLNEKKLILGLAHGYSRPTELGFISRFGLSATSTVHNTVLKLLRDGWLISNDDGYFIYDPLFLHWIQRRNGIS
jgi:hypothetical protein